MKKGLVFGVFDGLHDGHRAFLAEAAGKCDQLIVVVALPEVTEALKNRKPKYSYEERVSALVSYNPALQVIPGDRKIGDWTVLREQAPDVVFLGYDQKGIATELEKQGVPFIFLKPHKPEIYKSSLLNKTL